MEHLRDKRTRNEQQWGSFDLQGDENVPSLEHFKVSCSFFSLIEFFYFSFFANLILNGNFTDCNFPTNFRRMILRIFGDQNRI